MKPFVHPLKYFLGRGLLASGACLLLGYVAEPLQGQDGRVRSGDLPHLANGTLLLQWIDQEFPDSGDLEQRRHALESALTAFPEDRQTRFRALARIALVDQSEGHPDRAHAVLRRLLLDESGVDADLRGWAEILDARALLLMLRVPEAAGLLRKVASDGRLSGERRAMAAADAGNLLLATAPNDALSLLRGVAALKGGDTREVEAALVHALLLAGNYDAFDRELSRVAGPGTDESRLADLLEDACGWTLPGDSGRMLRLADGVGSLIPRPSATLEGAAQRVRVTASSRLVHDRLVELVAQGPLSACAASTGEPTRNSLADYQALMKQASRSGDAWQTLRLSVQSLVAFGGGQDVPRRVWEAAGFALWAERVQGSRFDSRICDALLDLCDQLPAGQEYWIEGKFLRADRRGKRGDLSGEQADLNRILSVANLSPAYLAPACKRLGRSLERAGDDQRALQAYELTEASAGDFATGVDCLLHAAWIHLRLGNDAEAVRLIQLLQASPDSIVAKSDSPDQVKELTALVRTGRAEAFWAYNRKWWPAWVQMEKAVGVEADAVEQRIPVVSRLADWTSEARRAADAGDAARYFRVFAVLLSASRWEPSMGPEAAAVSVPAFRFAPGQEEKLRGVLIDMLAAPHPPGIPNAGKRQLFLASNYLNAHKSALALRVASDFAAGASRGDPLAPAMHQIRGLAALDENRDCAPAAADLEADLAAPGSSAERAMATGVLANLYARLGRRADAVKLLQNAVADPALAADAAGRSELTRQLAGLNEPQAPVASSPAPAAVESQEAPTSGVLDNVPGWIRSISAGWYDYVDPQQVDERMLLDAEALIADPSTRFPPARQLKFLLLAAQDTRIRPELRQSALASAAARLVSSATDYTRMASLARSVMDHSAFDDESRLRVLWTLLASLAAEGKREQYQAWRKSPLCDHFTADIRSRLELLDLEAGLDSGDASSLERLSTTVASRKLDVTGVQVMTDVVGGLIRLGEVRAAGDLIASSASWRLDADAASRMEVVHLDLTRRLRAARELAPLHEAMRKSLLGSFPKVPRELPGAFRDLRISGTLPNLDRDATFEACLYMASKSQFNREDLSFWQTVFGSMPRTDVSPASMSSLLRAGLASAIDDEQRSELIVRFFSSADIDDGEIREGAEREFGPYRKTADFPRSSLVLGLYDIHKALRLGEPVSLQTAFDALNDPRVAVVRARDCLRYYTQTGEVAALRRTVDGIRSDTLLSAGFLCYSIPAFAKLGMDDELHSARAAARTTLRQYIEASWAFGDAKAADAALDLAVVLGDPDALPQDWVRASSRDLGDPLVRGRVSLVDALLRGDWPSVEASAAALLADYPHHYSLYWYRGLAQHHLGRDAEASEALETYTSHAKDEPDYVRALEMLSAAKAKPKAVP